MEPIVVVSTCDSAEEAERIARHLLELQLAACVNVLPGIRSFYRWQGVVENTTEWMLVIKTRRDLFDKLRGEFAKVHSYELPELIALPIVDGSDAYLAWLGDQLKPD